MISDRPKAGFP